MALLKSVRDYFDQRSQTRAFAAMVKRHLRATENRYLWRTLDEDERAVAMAACNSGAAAFLAPGVVDGLVRTPELALILLQHGATPTDTLVHNLHDMISQQLPGMSSLLGNHPAGSTHYFMVELLKMAVDRHPGLDWFAPKPRHGQHFPDAMAVHLLNLVSSGLCGELCQRRKEAGIPLGPLHAPAEERQALVDSLLTVYTDTHWWLPHGYCGQMVLDVLQGGGDVNALGKAATGELELCVLARMMRRYPDRVQNLLALGAQVDATVLGQVAYVMHDRSYTRRRPDAMETAFAQVVVAFGETVDLDMVVPSSDYYQPSLALVLKEHYPKTLENLLWRHQAEKLDESTPAAPSTSPRARL